MDFVHLALEHGAYPTLAVLAFVRNIRIEGGQLPRQHGDQRSRVAARLHVQHWSQHITHLCQWEERGWSVRFSNRAVLEVIDDADHFPELSVRRKVLTQRISIRP